MPSTEFEITKAIFSHVCEERTVEHVRGQVLPLVSRRLSLMTSSHRHDVNKIGEVTTAFIERHAHRLTNALVLQTLDKGEIPKLPSSWEATFQLQFGQCSYARRAKSGAIEEKSWKRPTVGGVEFPWSWLRRPIPPPNYGASTGACGYNRPCTHQISMLISVMHDLKWPINSTRIVLQFCPSQSSLTWRRTLLK